MGEMTDMHYASNSKANTGVALGATGLGLAVASMLGGCNGLGGVLGNIFGGNCNRGAELQYVSQLQAENSQLKSENYADKVGKDVYTQSLADNRMLRHEFFANINPLIAETHAKAVADAEKIARLEEQIKCCCETQTLKNQILDQKIDSNVNLLTGKISETALALNGQINTNFATMNGRMETTEAYNKGRFDALDQTIACIADKVNSVTKTALDSCKLCPGVVYASQGVPAAGTTWYPSCVNPLAPATTPAG